jgi:hypothetical protein
MTTARGKMSAIETMTTQRKPVVDYVRATRRHVIAPILSCRRACGPCHGSILAAFRRRRDLRARPEASLHGAEPMASSNFGTNIQGPNLGSLTFQPAGQAKALRAPAGVWKALATLRTTHGLFHRAAPST